MAVADRVTHDPPTLERHELVEALRYGTVAGAPVANEMLVLREGVARLLEALGQRFSFADVREIVASVGPQPGTCDAPLAGRRVSAVEGRTVPPLVLPTVTLRLWANVSAAFRIEDATLIERGYTLLARHLELLHRDGAAQRCAVATRTRESRKYLYYQEYMRCVEIGVCTLPSGAWICRGHERHRRAQAQRIAQRTGAS